MNTASTDTFEVSDLRELLEEQPATRLIDVRTGAEFETAHIPGSYNVPLDTLGEHRDELARRLDGPVVLICRSGNRATQAQQRLAEAGMSNLKVLDGGMLAWERAGQDVVRGREKWELERQVRLVAGALVLASIVASIWFPAARYVAGFVGAGLTFAALSNTCAMGVLLSKLPYNRSEGCDAEEVVAQLTTPTPRAA